MEMDDDERVDVIVHEGMYVNVSSNEVTGSRVPGLLGEEPFDVEDTALPVGGPCQQAATFSSSSSSTKLGCAPRLDLSSAQE